MPFARRSMARAVVDANILVSAIFGGLAAQALNTAISKCELWISEEIASELMAPPEMLDEKFSPEQARHFKSLIGAFFGYCRRSRSFAPRRICRDPGDEAYLSLAYGIQADFLVTREESLLKLPREKLRLHHLGNLRIVTPKEFIVSVREKRKGGGRK